MSITPQLAVSVLEAFQGAESPTAPERELLLLIAGGYTDEEIAARLHLSAEAIAADLSAVLRKLPHAVTVDGDGLRGGHP